MTNEEYLKQLADAQKQQKQVELEQQKAAALKSIEQEQAKVMPTYTAQKQQANVQSQLGAKNLAEFWANRGQTQQGISQQAELSRQNVLAGQLGQIGANEQSALQNFASQKGATETAYQSGLASATGEIDTNLATNLYNERLRQQQIAEAERIRIAEIKAKKDLMAYQAYLDKKAKEQEQTIPNGAIRVINGMPEVYTDGKWSATKYEKDTAGNIINTKTQKWNKQGYGLTEYDAPITYKKANGKYGTYKAWYKDGNYYIIDNEQPILISGDKEAVRQSINSATSKGNITTTRANEIMNALFPAPLDNASSMYNQTTGYNPANYYNKEEYNRLLKLQNMNNTGKYIASGSANNIQNNALQTYGNQALTKR